ncbi:MAG: carbon starvation protein A [Anaerolineae bacterium]
MFTIIVLILAAAALLIGYGWYAKTIDRDIIRPDPSKATPAKMYMDGVDFTPASRNVLFGYQFKSIAALGPIVGPIVAIKWGWLPALLWILLGTFFIGWVQDYASAVVAMREEGKTFGALSYQLISPRSRSILLIFIYLYLLLIMGAFGKIVGFDLMTNPAVPLGVLLVIGLGILAGQMTYKWKQDIILTTVITVVGSFIGIWLGTLGPVKDFFTAISGDPNTTLFLGLSWSKILWSLVVMVICYLGAVLPIWRWAQPINYVSFWIVFLGMLGGVIGMIIWHPGLPADFPAFTSFSVGGAWLWPVMFVTIACGAISGWHSLVSSSGTARQLETETDALPVGGGAMFLEMVLAVIALLTAVVGVGATAGLGYAKYVELTSAGKNAGVFAVGLAQFLSHIGIPTSFGLPYGSVFLTLMALTIMYLVVRFMRVASAEFLGDAVPVLKNVHVGSIVALILSIILVWTGAWSYVWVLFGGANQLMASLALLIITLWLTKEGKPNRWTFWPFIFMFVTTIMALIITAINALKAAAAGTKVIGNIFAGGIGIALIIAALFLAWDGWQALQQARAKRAAEA